MDEDFRSWLASELKDRGWSQSEAARRGGISASLVQQVMSGTSRPGKRFFRGIARAFGLPVEDVMRRAGDLPDHGEVLPDVRDWSNRLMAFDETTRALAVRAIEGALAAVEGAARVARR